MSKTLRASKKGLNLIDQLRKQKNWTKYEQCWIDLALTSRATLKRFWAGKNIQSDIFHLICEAVGGNVEEVADNWISPGNSQDNSSILYVIHTAQKSQFIANKSPSVKNPKEENWVNIPFPFSSKKLREKIKQEFLKEAFYSLCQTFCFDRRKVNQGINDLKKNLFFSRLTSRNDFLRSELDKSLCFTNRVGRVENNTFKKIYLTKRIRIAVGPGGIGTILIVKHMQNKGYNIDLNFNYVNSQDIVQCLSDNNFSEIADAIALDPTSAARASSNRKTDFVSLMLLPSTSNCVTSIGSNSKSSSLGQTIIVPAYEFSTSLLYLADLKQQKNIFDVNAKEFFLSEDDIISVIKDTPANINIISWWPQYIFYKLFTNNCQYTLFSEKWMYDLTTLFVSLEFYSQKEFMNVIITEIRNSWIELKLNRCLIENYIDELLCDPDYTMALCKFNALHLIENLDCSKL